MAVSAYLEANHGTAANDPTAESTSSADASLARPLASAIYEGSVRHRRHFPRAHAFRYRVAMLYLDLDEIDRVFAGRRLWSARGRNLAEFRRADYFGDAATPLADAIRARVTAVRGRRPDGPIRVLTHVRYFGFVFNPVTFYYCFAADGTTIEAIVAEITNTPWRERHAYVLPVEAAQRARSTLAWSFPKTFHVSPFLAMDRVYAWRFSVPAETLRVHMDVLRQAPAAHEREFDATLVLERRALDGRGLARVLWRYPLMTAKVIAAIHWQALRLWLRGIPVHDHPTLRGKTP